MKKYQVSDRVVTREICSYIRTLVNVAESGSSMGRALQHLTDGTLPTNGTGVNTAEARTLGIALGRHGGVCRYCTARDMQILIERYWENPEIKERKFFNMATRQDEMRTERVLQSYKNCARALGFSSGASFHAALVAVRKKVARAIIEQREQRHARFPKRNDIPGRMLWGAV